MSMNRKEKKLDNISVHGYIHEVAKEKNAIA